MTRRCLICANINPCHQHSERDQDAELDRNMRATVERDRMWRSPEKRRAFERERGFEPLGIPQSPEWEMAAHTGRLDAYMREFGEWAQREEDLKLYGAFFEVDGKRVHPSRVRFQFRDTPGEA